MLNEEAVREIQELLEHNEYKRGASIEALKVVQKYEGWVSDEALSDVAQLLDMSVDELDNVATFYNLIFRRPVGNNVILICNSVSCWLNGFEKVREQISSSLGIQLGETTPDKEFTLLPMVCLGDCDHAPVMMVGRNLHRKLSPDNVVEIFENYRGQRNPIA